MRSLNKRLKNTESYAGKIPTFAETLYQGSIKISPKLMGIVGCLAGMAALAFGIYIFTLGAPVAMVGLNFMCAVLVGFPVTGMLGFYLGKGAGHLLGFPAGLALAALAYAADYVLKGAVAAMRHIYSGAYFVVNRVSVLLDRAAKILSRKDEAVLGSEQNEVNHKALPKTTAPNTPSQLVIRSHLEIDVVHSQSSEDAATTTEITPTPPPSPSEYINYYKEAQGVKDKRVNELSFSSKP